MDGSDTDEEDDLDLRPRQRRRLNQEGVSILRMGVHGFMLILLISIHGVSNVG